MSGHRFVTIDDVATQLHRSFELTEEETERFSRKIWDDAPRWINGAADYSGPEWREAMRKVDASLCYNMG